MRFQGKLNGWQDDKGFGFVTPNGGGQQAFVHIKEFANRQRRPLGTEIITYAIAYDPMGRAQAEDIQYADERHNPAPTGAPSVVPLSLAAVFMAALGLAAASGNLPWSVPGAYLAASLTTYAAYWSDKSAARKRQWRTRESTLQLLALACGWPGALLAQYYLRHKSRKKPFLIMFWCAAAANCGALYWLLCAENAGNLRRLVGL